MIVDLSDVANHYKVARPGLLWKQDEGDPLPEDGGQRRRDRHQSLKTSIEGD